MQTLGSRKDNYVRRSLSIKPLSKVTPHFFAYFQKSVERGDDQQRKRCRYLIDHPPTKKTSLKKRAVCPPPHATTLILRKAKGSYSWGQRESVGLSRVDERGQADGSRPASSLPPGARLGAWPPLSRLQTPLRDGSGRARRRTRA